jgi:hypothetical protein
MPEGCLTPFSLGYLKVMFFKKERPHIEKTVVGLNALRAHSYREACDFLRKITNR